jgi:hypothetical protein
VLCPHQPLAQGRKAIRIKEAGDRRVARKRDTYALGASRQRQADGRYGVGGGKAERAAWFANPLGAGRKRVRRDKLGGTPKALGRSPA